jgi:hypothetical protein
MDTRRFCNVQSNESWPTIRVTERVSLAGASPLRKQVAITLCLGTPDCVHLSAMISDRSIWSEQLSLYSDFGRAGRMRIRGSITERRRGFYLLQNIHTGSGNHPAFYSMGTGKSLTDRRPRRDGGYNFRLGLRLRMHGAIPPLLVCIYSVVLN